MGESWSKFGIYSEVKDYGRVELRVDVTIFRNPTYFKVTVENA